MSPEDKAAAETTQTPPIKRVLSSIFKLESSNKRKLKFEEIVKIFAPNFDTSKPDSYIYYQLCTLNVAVCLVISAVIVVFAQYNHSDDAVAYLKIYSSLQTDIEYFLLAFFFIKAMYNVPTGYNFFWANPLWQTPELQKKRSSHMLVTSLVVCAVAWGLFSNGYKAFLLYRTDTVGYGTLYAYLIFSVFVFPAVSFSFLKSLFAIQRVIQIKLNKFNYSKSIG